MSPPFTLRSFVNSIYKNTSRDVFFLKDDPLCFPIYIILTHTGTVLSRIIRCYTKDEYSHVSIALDKNLENMYSFGRLNPYNPFFGGFVHEKVNEGVYKRFKNTKTCIYSLEIEDSKYRKIEKTINKMKKIKICINLIL